MSKSDENVIAVEMESIQDVKLLSLSHKLAHQFSVDAVGQCLGLQKSQVQDALKSVTEHHQDHNKVHFLLIKWCDLKEDKATWGALIEQSQSNPEIAGVIKNDLLETQPRKLRCYFKYHLIFVMNK